MNGKQPSKLVDGKESFEFHPPDHDGRVLGARGQFGAVWREAAEPNLVVVVVKDLRRVQRQLITDLIQRETN